MAVRATGRSWIPIGWVVLAVPVLSQCSNGTRDYDGRGSESGGGGTSGFAGSTLGQVKTGGSNRSGSGQSGNGGQAGQVGLAGQLGQARGGSTQNGRGGSTEGQGGSEQVDGEGGNAAGAGAGPGGLSADASAGEPDGATTPTCAAGLKLCNAKCIADSACCGDRDCPAGASCVSGACACAAGLHSCSEACVTDDSPDHCGTACTACPGLTGGTATCNGTSCGATCPAGQKACLGACIAQSASCNGACASGSHDCSGVCASNTAVTSCGATSCTPCPVPANSDATCTNGACGFTCKTNYKACGNSCIAKTACCQDSDCSGGKSCTAGACVCSGACCQDADCPANGTCALSSHTCQCATNFKSCGSLCIPATGCCGSNECTSPPSPSCSTSAVLRTYSGGTCSSNQCSYTQTDKTCAAGCQGGACQSVYPTQVALGGSHACALMNNGTVYCWGHAGHLGDGSNQDKTSAVQVSGISNAIQIVSGGGNTTYALLSDHTLKCWGDTADGELGHGAGSGYIFTPQAVTGLSNISEFQTDGATECALGSNAVSCWGRNADGVSSGPIRSVAISNVKHLADGTNCAILNNGNIQCWLGADGQSTTQPTGFSNVSQFSRQCALSGGKVSCWGANGYGQLGIGTTDYDDHPGAVPVKNLGGTVTQIAAASSHVCAILSDRSLWCWGKDGNFGALDYGPYPLQISGVSNAVHVSVSESSSCVVQSDYVVKCIGGNMFGQLGNGTTTDSTSPQIVQGLPSGG